MKSLSEIYKNKYIDAHLENAEMCYYEEINSKRYFYEDLPNTVTEGYPFASDFVSASGKSYDSQAWKNLSQEEKKGCKLRFHYLPNYHEIYLGCTGSGKTTGCIEPQLRALSYQKNKPNLFLSDPKGELFERNAEHLKACGYKLFVLNFKDCSRSDRWNPLLEIYDTAMQLKTIANGAEEREGFPDASLKLMASSSQIYLNGSYIFYKGMAFTGGEDLDRYVEYERDIIKAKVDSLINQLAHSIIKPQSNTDKSWEYGAQDLLKGLLVLLVDEALSSSTFTRDMMNMHNVQNYYEELKSYALRNTGELADCSLFKNGKHKKAFHLMETALNNAPNTMRSYCGVFDTCMKDWFQGHVFALTTGNTIDLDAIGDSPFAIFLITRDYEKSDFLIAGLFIDWVYRYMLEKTEREGISRPLHFMLDEFGNIPPIADFENKISTSRSREIFFHLVLQSYAQLDIVYGPEKSSVIIDNCNSLVFLGSQNVETKKRFSSQCGEYSLEAFSVSAKVENDVIQQASVLPISKLDSIVPGEAYIKRFRCPVIESRFIFSYICAEEGFFKYFNEANGIKNCTPIIFESYTSEKYMRYLRLPKYS